MATEQKTQAAQVIEALEQLGGVASLGDLYYHLLNGSARHWKTKTPEESIRRIVRNTKGIIPLEHGWYALETSKKHLNLDDIIEKRGSKEADMFNHYYYQGLAAEIGRAKEKKVFTPAQDRNRAFRQTTLEEVTTCRDMPAFGYERFTNIAKRIDVIWFNDRDMPCKLIEIEHSTDFNGALTRFLELQDFNTEMRIVASEHRRKQYEDKMKLVAFEPLKGRVEMRSYDEISNEHASLFDGSSLRNHL